MKHYRESVLILAFVVGFILGGMAVTAFAEPHPPLTNVPMKRLKGGAAADCWVELTGQGPLLFFCISLTTERGYDKPQTKKPQRTAAVH